MSLTNLQKLALITGDKFLLLIAQRNSKKRRRVSLCPPPSTDFNFNLHDKVRCWSEFRFRKCDIPRLQNTLGIPKVMKSLSGDTFSGLEGLCILLRRLAYPQRLCDLQLIFGRSIASISRIFNTMVNFVYRHHAHLLTSLNQWWMQPNCLRDYCEVIRRKGCPLPRCFGFIDGTIHKICRPIKYQREFYSGHKRTHGIKYQSVVLPNGIIANLTGIVPARRHDSYMLRVSGLVPQMEALLTGAGVNYYMYGDSGYPIKRFLIKPYQGHHLSAAQQEFNTTMSKLRICVEWEFGDLFKTFAVIDFKKNQKVWLQPVAKYVTVSAILKNCKTCLYGSETFSYFNLDTPTLENYIQNIPE